MLYVTYNVAPQQKGQVRRLEIPNRPLQTKSLEEFFKDKQQCEIVDSYTDILESRRTAKWSQLQKALELCKQKKATLLIVELGTLASHGSFTQRLLDSNVPFLCLDQPFVDRTILEALRKHAEVQRKLHGKLIREGLKLTSAKSGNPNAALVISKVNKPKIDTAIVFALLLQPIVQDYRQNGYSQRQMVKALNEEGFTAPEGGKWVLSQLQKVLDRVRLNEIAISAKPILLSLNFSSTKEIADALTTNNILPFKTLSWDESQVKKLQDRLQQIEDISFINRCVLTLLPLLKSFQAQNLTPVEMIAELHQAGIPVRKEELLTAPPTTTHPIPVALIHLKEVLQTSSRENAYLDFVLESAAKHLPVYFKIVKSHIEQLATVLDLDTHYHRNLDNAGLAEPVLQLIQLFRELSIQDIELLENLSMETHHWALVEPVTLLEQKNMDLLDDILK